LPGATIKASYVTEYSTDTIEMHIGAVVPGSKVVLVDDLIATGGTLSAGKELIEMAGGSVMEAACIVELPDLKGRQKVGDLPMFVVVQKEGL
jgi:adenine phosphoribosyltransferase